jgi:hypothetical protein
MRDEKIGTAQIKVLEVEQIDVPSGTIAQFVGIDESGLVVRSSEGGGGGGGGGVTNGDYGDIVVSNDGDTWTVDAGAINASKLATNAVTTEKIDGLAVTTGKIASNAVTAGKLDTGAVTTAKIADANVTQAKLSATGAGAGKVLTTDGSSMTWEEPAGGGSTEAPVGHVHYGLNFSSSAPFVANTATPGNKAFIDKLHTDYIKYACMGSPFHYDATYYTEFKNWASTRTSLSRYITGFADNEISMLSISTVFIERWADDFTYIGRLNRNDLPHYLANYQVSPDRLSVDAVSGKSIIMASVISNSGDVFGYYYNENNTEGWKVKPYCLPGVDANNYAPITSCYVANNNYFVGNNTAWYRTADHVNYTPLGFNNGFVIYETSQAGHLIASNGTTVWHYSADYGVTWSTGTALPNTPTYAARCIDYNGTHFVLATGAVANEVYYTSTHNGSWTTRAAGGASLANTPDSVWWCHDRWIFLIRDNNHTPATNYGGYSTNITSNYTVGGVATGTINGWFAAIYRDGTYFLLTNEGYHYSTNGTTYTRVATVLQGQIGLSTTQDAFKTRIFYKNGYLYFSAATSGNTTRIDTTSRALVTIAHSAQTANIYTTNTVINNFPLWVKYV